MLLFNIYIFASSIIFCLIATPFIKLVSLRFNIVKKPNHITVHESPMPLLGGIAIVLSMIASIVSLFFIFKLESIEMHGLSKQPLILFFSGLIILVLGVFDDIKGVSPWGKFMVQALAASIIWVCGIRFDFLLSHLESGTTTDIISFFMTLLWMLSFTNAMNLIDGLDGLATGISSISFLSLGIISYNSQILSFMCVALAGATLGFLRFNFNPAKIFLGDTGSLFLGYMLGGISLVGAMKTATISSIMIPIILMGLPAIDTGLSIIRRVLKNTSIFQGDKEHIHHKLLEMGFSHRRVVIILYSFSVLFSFLALYLTFDSGKQFGLVVLVFSVVSYLAFSKLGYKEYLKLLKYRIVGNGDENIPLEVKYFDLTSKLNVAKKPEDIWETASKLINMIGFERSSLHFLDPERKKIIKVFSWAQDLNKIEALMTRYQKIVMRKTLGEKGSIVSYQLSQGKPEILFIRSKDEMNGIICNEILKDIAAEQFVSVPIIGKNGALGYIVADKYFSSNPIKQEEVAMLASLAAQIAAIVECNQLSIDLNSIVSDVRKRSQLVESQKNILY